MKQKYGLTEKVCNYDGSGTTCRGRLDKSGEGGDKAGCLRIVRAGRCFVESSGARMAINKQKKRQATLEPVGMGRGECKSTSGIILYYIEPEGSANLGNPCQHTYNLLTKGSGIGGAVVNLDRGWRGTRSKCDAFVTSKKKTATRAAIF